MHGPFSTIRYHFITTVLAGLFILSGCDKEDPAPTKTIYQLISEEASLSMIKQQIDLNADLKLKLEASTGSYTFFAPNDLAMNALLTTLGRSDFASISPQVLSTILNYHLANTVKNQSDMSNGAKIETNQGEDITIEVTSGGAIKLVTSASMAGTVSRSIAATNGVLHIVEDYVLIPSAVGGGTPSSNVAQPIMLGASFTILASAILKADAGKPQAETILAAMISMTSQTFFAVPNDAFNAAQITIDTFTAAEWDAIIRGHMVPDQTVDAITGQTLPTMFTKPGAASPSVITTTASSGTNPPTAKGAANAHPLTVLADSKITMGNGTIFPVLGLIEHKPSKSIYQLISEDASLAIIKGQIDADADLKMKLEASAGNYTFFVANDLAMEAMLTSLGFSDFSSVSPAVMSAVLNYHLANTVFNQSDMNDGLSISTEQGEDIQIEVTGPGSIKLVTGATAKSSVLSSIAATNGVLHIVSDIPLIPPTIGQMIAITLGTVAQPILLGADFTVLAAAIQKADAGKPAFETIVGAMVGMYSQTLFAIQNQVFVDAAGGPITVDTFSAAQWNAIIRGHMIPQQTIETISDATLPTLFKAQGAVFLSEVTTTAAAGNAPPTVKGDGNANAIVVVVTSKITKNNGTIFPIGGIIDHTP